MATTTINFRDDAPGGGKTTFELRRLATTPGLYLFACDRREAIWERVDSLRASVTEAGSSPAIRVICTPEGTEDNLAFRGRAANAAAWHAGWSVAAQIAALSEDHDGADHLIVFCTHEGLKQADLDGFEGWNLIIDETPSAFELHHTASPVLYGHLSTHYSLEELPERGWSVVRAKEGQLTLADYRADDTMSGWAAFHKRVTSRRGVLCDLTEWEDVQTRRRWSWWSMWSPLEIRAFQSVTILASAFTETVTYRLWASNHGHEIAFRRLPTPNTTSWTPRRVLVRFFSNAPAGSHFWASTAGQGCLAGWGAKIAELHPGADGTSHLYSCNGRNRTLIEAAGINGDFPTIRVAGSNRWREVHVASIAYSAKVQPSERPILGKLGVSPDDVLRAREYEDIRQFVTRTSLRDPLSTADVTLNVYDAQQAAMLVDFLSRHYPFDVTSEFIDIGLDDVARRKPGRPKNVMTEAELRNIQKRRSTNRAQQQRERRARKKEGLARPVESIRTER